MTQRKIFEIGGYVAAAALVAFGIAAIVMGVNGRNEVRSDVQREFIVGSPDMNKTAILAEAKQAKLPAAVIADLPTCNVADKAIVTGAQAKCFASYMRIHTLESTGGQTYSQLGRYVTAAGKATNDPTQAALVNGQPKENPLRNLWVTETALSTALNTSFFAEQVAMFGIVVGIALLLSGFGFGILAFTAFRWLPAQEKKKALKTAAAPVVA